MTDPNNKSSVESVQEYYGKTLKSSQDLKTTACCVDFTSFPEKLKSIFKDIHPEISKRYYGCGLTIPSQLEGLHVIDLGSGSGRDSFVLSKLVGSKGSVIGIDMTDEQLDLARDHISYHTEKYGYKNSNIEFRKGKIEDLAQANIKDESVDLIVSNCVINLSFDKQAVLNEAFRVLKPGGELFFADVYSNRRVPAELVKHPLLYNECLSGALYWNDFISMGKKAGFKDPRLVSDRVLEITNPQVRSLVSDINFYSATYRLFKLPELEPACEDYGQAVIYQGTVDDHPKFFDLDNHHRFLTGKIQPVCNNTFLMLEKTRFKNHFHFLGNTEIHYGIYPDCGVNVPFSNHSEKNPSPAACC